MTIIRLKPKYSPEVIMDQNKSKHEKKKKEKKDKKKKEKKQRKREQEDGHDDASVHLSSADENALEPEMNEYDSKVQEKSSNPKKQSRSHRAAVDDADDDDDDDDNDEAGKQSPPKKKQKISDKKEARVARRLERKKLMEQVPKTDEYGIAYTKLQLRRMCKRVAKGLNPIESEAEKQERLRREAELRREEEMELAGMMHNGSDNNEEDSEQETEEVHKKHEDGSEDDNDDDDDDDADAKHVDEKPKESVQEKAEIATKQIKQKSHRNKPVPHDYVCSACQNRHKPAHWIYDCPDKVTVRGTNQVSKKTKGIKNPDIRKVFVSGLPFDIKIKDVEKIFAACGPVLHCKLIKFQDTGRCKGQAYVQFSTENGAKKALEMSGSVIQNSNERDVKKEESSSSSSSPIKKRKELKLKVTKALNRTMTKGNK